jgi:hypothetical protein
MSDSKLMSYNTIVQREPTTDATDSFYFYNCKDTIFF